MCLSQVHSQRPRNETVRKMPVEYIRRRLSSHSNLMSDSPTPEETKAAAARKQQLAAMGPQQPQEALRCALEASLQCTRRIDFFDAQLARLEKGEAAAAAISDNDPLTHGYSCLHGCAIDAVERPPSPTGDANAEVERSPSPSENTDFMQRDYASPNSVEY